MMQPVALVCIGGLVYATALTLLVVPIMYDILTGRPTRQSRTRISISAILCWNSEC